MENDYQKFKREQKERGEREWSRAFLATIIGLVVLIVDATIGVAAGRGFINIDEWFGVWGTVMFLATVTTIIGAGFMQRAERTINGELGF